MTLCVATGEGIVWMFNCSNYITEGLFGAAILLLLWSLIYFRNRTEPTREAAVGASFITLIVAVLMRVMGVINDTYVGIALVVFIGSLVLLVMRD